MVTALIFAGGTGQRMNARSKPKQFLELHGKPIIIYTLEHFEFNSAVDNIMVVCLESWIEELKGMLNRYSINKVAGIVPGGATGLESIWCGLTAMRSFALDRDIVLIHDGVRPLISADLITRNIESVQKYGNAITVEASRESIVRSIDGEIITDIPQREQMYIAKAPQSFYYGDIVKIYQMAAEEGVTGVDSAQLCSFYHVPLHIVPSPKDNIKITDPADYYMFKAIYEALEGQQIFGLS